MKKITNFVLFVFLLVNQYQNVSIDKMDEVQKEKVSTFSLVAKMTLRVPLKLE